MNDEAKAKEVLKVLIVPIVIGMVMGMANDWTIYETTHIILLLMILHRLGRC